MLLLLVPGVGMGGSAGEAPPIGDSVTGGRRQNRMTVSIYCFAPALFLLEYLLGR